MINGRLEVDYLSEARYGEIMDIGVAVDSFEQRRYQAAFEIADEATGRAVCRARMRMVFIDAQRHERRDVPESFVVAYRRLEARAGSPGA